MMARSVLPLAVVEALKGAGATEEMIAAAAGACGAFEDVPRARAGRRRKYADRAECDRAYRERKRAREEMREEITLREETREETPTREEIRDEIGRVRGATARPDHNGS
jgi:hypothetical protein